MKYQLFSFVLILTLLISCNSNDNDYENQFLMKQQRLLERQLDLNIGNIMSLYFSNQRKYEDLHQIQEKLYRSFKNVKADFKNNKNEIYDIISYCRQDEYFSFIYKEILKDIENDLDSNDDHINNYIINNLLILINEILHSEIQRFQSKGFHYTDIEPYVVLEKREYKIGDVVKASLFVKASDSTQKHMFVINEKVIKSFYNNGDAIFEVVADKKGKNVVKGKLIYPIGGTNKIDSTLLEFEYVVK